MFNLLAASSSSSSSSSEDDENIVVNIILPEIQPARTKNEDYVEVTVHLYTDKELLEHFRLSRQLISSLAKQYQDSKMYASHDTGHMRITPEKCILIFLWYAGHEAASFRDVADRFNITISTLHHIVEKVSLILSNLSSTIIRWPTDEEKLEISQDFQRMGFPNALGCIDGCHIKIDTPSDDAESYFNRKKFYSIQMQGICDSKRRIRDIFIGYPGSVHDSRVLRNSPIFDKLPEKCGDKFILGDSAYPCLRHLLTPYRDTGRLTPIETNFNKKLSRSRIIIEHTFGLLKQKFRQLYHIKLRNITTICHFIRACCVLHNLFIDDKTDIEVLDETGTGDVVGNLEEIIEDDENEGNEAGHLFRNYVASVLFHN